MRAALLGALLLAAAPAGAQPRLEVQGTVEPGTPLLIVVELRNAGTTAAHDVVVEGELAGEYDQGRVREPLPAGATRRLALSFRRAVPGPGVRPLAMLVDFKDPAGAATSQRAWLLVSFGTEPAPAPAVAVALPEASIGTALELPVRVRSLDGRPRRVRVRVLPPRGLQVPDPPPSVEVGAAEATVPVRVLRSGAPRPSTQGLLAFAEWEDEGRASVAVATGTVRVEPDPARLPRLRPWLVGAGAALLLLAAAREITRARRARHEA